VPDRILHIKFRNEHAARRENGTVQKGAWSEIFSAVIP
jgi:hypothetical protein